MVRAAEPKVEIKVHPASEIAQGQVVTVECDIVGDVSDTFDTHGESRFPRCGNVIINVIINIMQLYFWNYVLI